MNRTHLESTVVELAEALGYPCVVAPDDYLPGVAALPAARLAPVEFHEIEGRRHGRITYDLTLRLLREGLKRPHAARTEVWEQMENDLLELFNRLSDSPRIIAVEQLTLTPAAGTLTPHGELSQTAHARIITSF